MNERDSIKSLSDKLTCDAMDKAWELFYKWHQRTMKENGKVNTEESIKKFKEIIESVKICGCYTV